MSVSEASVATDGASRYLQQLCKHWSHKFAVIFDKVHGTVPFEQATCTFDAAPAAHTRRGAVSEEIARMEEVVAKICSASPFARRWKSSGCARWREARSITSSAGAHKVSARRPLAAQGCLQRFPLLVNAGHAAPGARVVKDGAERAAAFGRASHP